MLRLKKLITIGAFFALTACTAHTERATIYEGSSKGAQEVLDTLQKKGLVGDEPISARKFTDKGVIVMIKKGVPEDNWGYVNELKIEATKEFTQVRGQKPEYVEVQRVKSIPFP